MLGPAVDLAGEVVARPSVPLETHLDVVDLVQRGEYAYEVVVDSAALVRAERCHFRGGGTSLDHLHDVKLLTDDGGVVAMVVHFGYRHIAVAQGVHDAMFPFHLVGGR